MSCILNRAEQKGSRPIHVEIRPRDRYLHHVRVEHPGEIIAWSFFTRRKNLAFGLQYVHTIPNQASPRSSPKKASLSRSGSVPTLHSTGEGEEESSPDNLETDIKSILMSSKADVFIEPSAIPRGNQMQRSSSEFESGDRNLARSNTTAGRSNDEGNEIEGLTRQNNASLPDLRASPPSVSGGANNIEYVDILPIEKYESFETTISGHYKAPIPGTYLLIFDNRFSINTSKELFLTVTVGPFVPTAEKTFAGWLLKRKQFRLGGWARRWFELDRKGILSYFEDRFSPCRGSVDLNHCALTKIPQKLLMTVDSGHETYHLRAFDEDEYNKWSEQFNMIRAQQALESMTLNTLNDTPISREALTHAEYVTDLLQKSEKLLLNLRSSAEKDGCQLQYLAPLEESLRSLHDLYDALSEYAIFLQRTGRRMSNVKISDDVSFDEFFDAQEIVLTEYSDDDVDTIIPSKEAMSVEPSEVPIEFVAPIEEIVTPSAVVPSSPLPEPKYSGSFRTKMPSVAPPCNISLGSILRKSIGKDWSAMAMPVALNEPLSALQRMCEELEYSELLDTASQCTSSVDRMMYVIAFAISGYASTVHRAERKPFTPILGETFEYESIQKGFKFISEKVCHRPLVVACHAHSEKKWSFWQDQRMKSKFWGKSMEYLPTGSVHVYFADNGDHFVWNKVVTCVRNILSGNKWVENYGDMLIRNDRTGDTAKVVFKASGGFFSSGSSSSNNEVSATIIPSRDGSEAHREPVSLRGRWDSMICQENIGQEAKIIWKASPIPNDHGEYFGFSDFAITLNDLPEWLKPLLPQTDSRFRPDQRLLELGTLDEAEKLKLQLEQKQRDLRQELEGRGESWKPTWFKFDSPTKDDPEGAWRIKDPSTYWHCRQKGEWPEVSKLW